MEVRKHIIEFNGALTLGAAADGSAGLIQATTGTPGSIVAENGVLKIPLAATEEAEVNRALQGTKPYRLADLVQLRILAAISDLGDNSHAVFGLCGTPNDDADAIAEGIFWKVLADNTVVLESDDGTTDVDDSLTNQSLGTTLREFVLDFRSGVVQGDPRFGGSQGGLAMILASMTNASGKLVPVCRGSRFRLDNATGPLQFFAQMVKASSTDTGNLYIRRVEVQLKDTLYAVA